MSCNNNQKKKIIDIPHGIKKEKKEKEKKEKEKEWVTIKTFLLTKRRKIIDKKSSLKIDLFFNMSLLLLNCLVLWFS